MVAASRTPAGGGPIELQDDDHEPPRPPSRPLLAAALLALPGVAAADTTVVALAPLSALIAMTDDGVAPRLTLSGSGVTAADEVLFGKRWFVRWF